MTHPLLSVIVPTYGRAEHIGPLIESVLAQSLQDWELIVVEDGSPRQQEVRAVIERYLTTVGPRLRFYTNDETLGYDANIRKLIELARGEFVFLMGDDDRVAAGAFEAVAAATRKYPKLGVIIRAYTVFRGDPSNVIKTLRHYPQECVFPAGPQAIVAAHRRLVAMAGIVIHRDSAVRFATDRFDGLLFYQQWLSGNILLERDAVYIPTILAHVQDASVSVFGTAKAEKGLYVPGAFPPSMDLRFVGNLVKIAEAIEKERGVAIVEHVRRDFANHMYPVIAHQAHQPWRVFFRFYRDLGRQGFDKYPQFHAWFWAVAIIGPKPLFWTFQTIRRVFGYSPNLTRFVRADAASSP